MTTKNVGAFLAGVAIAVIGGLILYFITQNIGNTDHINKIEDEIRANYEIIKNIQEPSLNRTLSGGIILSQSDVNKALAKNVRNEAWKSLVADISYETKLKYDKVYLYTNAIVDDSDVPEKLKSIILFENSRSFIEEYNKLLKD